MLMDYGTCMVGEQDRPVVVTFKILFTLLKTNFISVFLGLRIPWTEEPDRLQSMGSQESDMT